MQKLTVVLAVAMLMAPISSAHSQTRRPFSFHAASVRGFATGKVRITGGGTFDPVTKFVKAGGSFRCEEDINQGPFTGLKAGEGVRWDSEELLPSVDFKCTGLPEELKKTAFTDDNTVVIRADFYRAGDGNNASLHAIMFVSLDDEDGVLPGFQNVWVQGVGCADNAIVHFN